MKLSTEQFAELNASFDAVPASTYHERRRASRLELEAQVKITPLVAGKRQPSIYVTACDYSARGISILHPSKYPAGQQFITELPRKSGGILELLCTVMHARPDKNGMYKIGAEFTCSVPAASEPVETNNKEMQRIRASMLG